MPRQLFLFERPSRFVAGTVGLPGERTFFLQAVDGARVVSVSIEKQQVALLADRLEQLVEDVAQREGAEFAATPVDGGALEQPVEEEFRVGALGLAWDAEAALVIVEAQAVADSPEEARETLLEDVEEGPDTLRVRLEPAAARSFITRARQVVSAGSPPCPLCGGPLDPKGHVCPRHNGYRRAAG